MAQITVKDLQYIYSRGTPFEMTAVHDVSLQIEQGESVFVLGHTGSGKSTFVQHLNALLQPTGGKVMVDGIDINRDKATRREIKTRIGLVFQYPEYQLFDETVEKDIAFGPKNMKLKDAEIRERVLEAAKFAGVDEALFRRSPLELSGGQKRRVAIAGVIAMRPEVLILDEPTAGLDPAGSRQLMDHIRAYRETTGATVIIVSHSMDDAAQYGERLIVFNQGTVWMDGPSKEVFQHPDELEKVGLNIPGTAALAAALRQAGLPLDASIFTHEQLMAALQGLQRTVTC